MSSLQVPLFCTQKGRSWLSAVRLQQKTSVFAGHALGGPSAAIGSTHLARGEMDTQMDRCDFTNGDFMGMSWNLLFVFLDFMGFFIGFQGIDWDI